ncbi:hypothetical protein [Brevibacterium album]|uniref:hypothetical protein n=1 Tax=Brevibacterium album TaxID=417948 RepID=UPI0004013B1F|nr:hypothetical protein [Brevibacterium album]
MGASRSCGPADPEGRFALLFEDLEAVEAGRDLHERAGEFSDLVAGELADHGLAERVAGAQGMRIAVTAAGAVIRGVLELAAETWLRIAEEASGASVLVALGHVDEVRLGTRRHARPPQTLSFASPLRRLSAERTQAVLGAVSGSGEVRALEGGVRAVGDDYVELAGQGGAGRERVSVLVPLRRIAWVRVPATVRGAGL